ncbi:MAG: Hpt domain-containing protein [Phycisphaerae bacterium]|nr:Hpt domain-containing protein [Phycisphaerae bacterium]
MANQNASSRGPILSEYANDADMAELVESFVAELPKRIESITSAVTESRATDLKRIAHQLRGAAPGYGFPSIGAAAATLEDLMRQAPATAELATFKSQVDELIDLCSRAASKR